MKLLFFAHEFKEEMLLNIHQKIAAVRKSMAALNKNKRGHVGSYVSEESATSKLQAALDIYNLNVYPSIVPGTFFYETFANEKGKTEFIVRALMEFTFVDVEKPEDRVVIPWAFIGQQSKVDYAFGSGLTYANRYFLLKFFEVSTSDDDPETIRSRQEEAREEIDEREREQALKIAQDRIAEIVAEVKRGNGITVEQFYAVIEKYTPSSLTGNAKRNPKKIEDVHSANLAIEELETLMNKGE